MIVVLMVYKKEHVMELKYSLTSGELKCMGLIFVDNTNLTVIAKEEGNIEDIKERQQQDTLC